ncbi:MAG: hypothetical protein ABMB14_09530 [Myxococcota bacterium]
MGQPFELIGSIYNNSHPSTPVVVGDLGLLVASYLGDDGTLDDGPVELDGGTAYAPDLELKGPTVFRRGTDEVWLLTSVAITVPVTSHFTGDELVAALDRPFGEVLERGRIEVRSGHLALTLAYNPVPAHDADTARYRDAYYPGVPHVPAIVPAAPVVLGQLNASDEDATNGTLILVPLPPGTYEILLEARSDDSEFVRCLVRRSA